MISVIIPVYNAEHFLQKCISSLVSQTYKEWQAIFVDDGSTDGSLKILEREVLLDKRMEIVRLPKNQGLPHARNAALEHVRGNYVCTLDADDWLAPDAFEQAIDVFENHPQTDCVLFRFVYVNDDTKEEQEFPLSSFTMLSGKEVMRRTLLDWDGIHGIYLVRTSIQRQYPFDETTRVYSDENTARLHFFASREVRSCTGTYYYRQHSDSLSHQGRLSYFDRLKANESLLHSLCEAGVEERDVALLHQRCWLAIVDAYYYYFIHRRDYSDIDSKKAFSEIQCAWSSIIVSMIPRRCRSKFGYWPLRFSWRLFCLQEEFYFRLRAFREK